MENKSNDIYLIDGSAFIYRAFFAIRGLSSADGKPTNAVYGFTNMLIKLMRDKDPESVIVTFDTPHPTERHEIYKEYKAHRPDTPDELIAQIQPIKEVVRAMNLVAFEMPGYEADDILATLAAAGAKRGKNVFIASGDKDLLQLVDRYVKIYDPMKDKVMGRDEVIERFSVPPERVTEYMALVGDTSDNIPGVKGIGDKSAKALLAQFGSLKEMTENLDAIEKPRFRKLITENMDNLWLSKRLVEINREVPIEIDDETFTLREPDEEKLREMFTELG
ncbi:5'-3' exonuclease H3TH domain-containing protein, partial [Nitrospirota bacterium]